MIDKQKALEYVLKNEDAHLSGVETQDRGGRTRFGVAEKYHPELSDTGFFDTMSKDEALRMADQVYDEQYLEPLRLGELESQPLANKVLDMAINLGLHTATKLVQEAANASGAVPSLVVDNKMGPATLYALQSLDPDKLISNLRAYTRAYYDSRLPIVGYSPAEYLSYIRRANEAGI